MTMLNKLLNRPFTSLLPVLHQYTGQLLKQTNKSAFQILHSGIEQLKNNLGS